MLGASGAFKSKSPLLKSNPSELISFVAAFVQRLDAGASVSDLQRSLKHKLKNKNYSVCSSSESAFVVRCRRASAKYPSELDATDTSLICNRPLQEQGDAANCCSGCHTVSAGDITVSTSEEPTVLAPCTVSSAGFSEFCCYSASEPHALSECVGAVPVYRALCRPDRIRSSLCDGGGDALDDSTFPSELAFAGVRTLRHYAYVAIIDSGTSSHHFGDTEQVRVRRPAHVIITLADGTKLNIDTKGDVVLPSENAPVNYHLKTLKSTLLNHLFCRMSVFLRVAQSI